MINEDSTGLTIEGLKGNMMIDYYEDTEELDLTIDAPAVLYVMNLKKHQAEMIRDFLNVRYPR